MTRFRAHPAAALAACLGLVAATASLAATALAATPRSPADSDRLAHDLFAELVGIDTTHAKGSAKAAEALIARFKAAGFADSDLSSAARAPTR